MIALTRKESMLVCILGCSRDEQTHTHVPDPYILKELGEDVFSLPQDEQLPIFAAWMQEVFEEDFAMLLEGARFDVILERFRIWHDAWAEEGDKGFVARVQRYTLEGLSPMEVLLEVARK